MNKMYSNNFSLVNIYKKMSRESEIVTQMLHGDRFSILLKKNNWWKIKIKEDGYIGFIKKKKFNKEVKPTHKICTLYANIYKEPNTRNIIEKLSFGSKITFEKKYKKFTKFQNKWIKTKNLKSIKYENKDIFYKIEMFKNTKYKWGGKSFNGLDCSALVQIFLNFNNMYCPRDASDQVKYFKKNISLNNIKKNDIIYWKGHVAVVLSKKKVIHAYGPMKKTVIMSTNETINKIEKTANLKVVSIKRLKK